jgi:hypothetical protein
LTTGFLPLPPTIDGLAWSQQIFFLGYPYGLATQIKGSDPGDRIAFVKSGIWSATATVDGVDLIYIDGHNNPGFSGGPVIGFKPGATEAQVFGVISGYRLEHQPLYAGTTEISEITAVANSGIVIATSINHVLHALNAASAGSD